MSDDVFFFGAGFSKSINEKYPTLKELSEQIRDDFKGDKTSIGKHYNKGIPKKYHNNIEMLLSYLLMHLPYKKGEEKYMDKALYENVAKKIANSFYKLDINTKLFIRNDYNIQFGDYIKENNCTCITLNYDLLLERILGIDICIEQPEIPSKFYKIPMRNLAKQGQVDNYDYIDNNTVPNIIKLHGSQNWFYSEDVDNEIYIYHNGIPEDTLNILCSFQYAYLKPFIIPPILDKSMFYSNALLKTLWKQAFEAIQNAKNIYIYGFSFPETDYYIKFLFQSALKDNKNNYKIYVINKCYTLKELEELKKKCETPEDLKNLKELENNILEKLKDKYNSIFGKNRCNYYCCVKEGQLEKLMNIIEENNKKKETV